jgi:hypothetical protein
VGLPIIKHYCQMSGKSSVSIITDTKEKKCCCAIPTTDFSGLADTEDKNHPAIEKDDCCNTETSYEKANFEAVSIQKAIFDFGHFVATLPSQIRFKTFTEKTFFSSFCILSFVDLPAPNWKLGKLFIVFIQVFRL